MIGSKLELFKELSFFKQKSQFSERIIWTTFVQKDQINGTPSVSHLGAIKVLVITINVTTSSVARGRGGLSPPPHWHVDQNAE